MLTGPAGIVVDRAGNVYVSECDWTYAAIVRIDPKGMLTRFAGTTEPGFTGDGGPATAAELYCPIGMAFTGDGAMVFADHVNNRIRRVDTAGIITTIVGGGGPDGLNLGSFKGDGGPALDATLQEPYGVAVDGKGNLYISDRDNDRIRKVDPSGIISTIAGNGMGHAPVDGVLGTTTSISFPLGIAVDPRGDVVFGDANNKRIRRIDSHGIITTIAGTGKNEATGDGGPASKASLADPENVVFDAADNLFITDTVFDRLRRVDMHGVISTLASHKGGSGLAIDRAGNLYVTNADAGGVYRIDMKGTITLIAGKPH
jgi:sugar lactone lactonase YvrE